METVTLPDSLADGRQFAGFEGHGQLKNTGGRPKGVPNKLEGSARWAMNEAFRLCGGVYGLVAWAKKNPKEFYPLYIRAMVPKPMETAEPGSNAVTIVIQRLADQPSACKQLPQAEAQAEETG